MNFNIEIPDWVDFIAQDEDGDWYGYDTEPYLGRFPGEWSENKMICLAHCKEPKNFTEELFEIIR